MSKWFLSQQAQEHWLAAWNNIIHIQVYDVDCFYSLLHKSLVKECSNTASQCNRWSLLWLRVNILQKCKNWQ